MLKAQVMQAAIANPNCEMTRISALEFRARVDRCHRLSDLTALLNIAAMSICDTATERNAALEYGFCRREKMILESLAEGSRGAGGFDPAVMQKVF